jgi:pimeloyl-ACP methyl ester carboxylesterase
MPEVVQFEDIPVSWLVDEIDVEASLTRPAGDGPFPAVIMVAGSGPTDRNWNSPLIPGANGSAALLAQALTERGFITLRYDKRASGPKGQANAMKLAGKISLQGHLEELAGGVDLLAGRAEVDARHIFALTNSEGCIHALNYQVQRTDRLLAGLVLTSPFARPAGVLARAQIAAQIAPLPGGSDLMAAYDAAMADFAAGRPVDVDANLLEGLRNVILGITHPGNQPFSRELWVADPLALLARVTAPVLILIGKQDIQVDWQIDGALFEALLKDHGNLSLVYADHANHVLKHEPRDRSQFTPAKAMLTYSAAETQLDDDVLKVITAWLKRQL